MTGTWMSCGRGADLTMIGAPRRNACRQDQKARFGKAGARAGFALGLSVLALPLAAFAAGPRSADLKWQALQIDAEVHAAAAARGHGASVVVMVGSADGERLLRQVRVRVDGGEPLTYDFSHAQSKALRAGGLFPLAELPLAAGEHRLSAEFISRTTDVRNKARFDRLDESVMLPAGRGAIVLQAEPPGTFGATAPSWRFVALPAGPAGDGDPRARAARTLSAGGEHFRAAALLMRAQRGGGAALPAGSAEALGRALRAYGLPRQAASYLEQAGVPPQSSPLPALAEAAPTVENLSALAESDVDADDAIGLALRDRANLLLGHRQLEAGNREAAIDAYRQVRSPGPYSTEAMLGLGWAQVWPSAVGRDADGTGGPPPSELLGLGGRDGALAAARRRLPFRYYTSTAGEKRADDLRRALVPWAELAGRDPLDPAVEEGMLAVAYALDHLGSRQQAQSHYQRASQLMELSLRRLEAAREHVRTGGLAAAVLRLGRDGGTGWAWWLTEVDDGHWWLQSDEAASPSFYIRYLLESGQWRDAAQGLRELAELDAAMAADLELARSAAVPVALQERIGSMRARIADESARQRQTLDALALDELARTRKRVEQCLVEALFQLARLHDRPAASTSLAAAGGE